MRIILIFWKTFTWAFIVLILSLLPGGEVEKAKFINIPHFDKIVHFVMYYTLNFLLIASLIAKKKLTKPDVQIFLTALACALAYGGVMEFVQGMFAVNRSGDIFDFAANTLGAFAATFSFLPITSKLNFVNKILRL